MADFRDKNTGEVFTVPDSESGDIEALRANQADFEEVKASPDVMEQERKSSGTSKLESFARGLGQGTTFGFGEYLGGLGGMAGDKIARLVNDLGYEGTGPSYREQVETEREANRRAAEDNPISYLAGDIASSAAIPMPAAKSAGALGRAAIGAGTGALQYVGQSDAETPQKVVRNAIMGGTGGAIATPLVEGVVSLGAKGGGKIARTIAEKLDPEGRLLQRAKRIEKTGEMLAGPSPTEELAETERLIGEHGKAIKESIAENTQRQVQDDLSGIVRSDDKIMTLANTSLKGTAAMKGFASKLESIPLESRNAFQQKIFDKADSKLNDIREALGKIKQRAKGRLASTSAGTQSSRIETAIESYENLLGSLHPSVKNDPGALSDTYIALDNIKRSLGTAQSKIRDDTASKEAIRSIYMNLRGFLEDEKLWGQEVTGMQKDINKAWSKYLDVTDAVESSFMRGRSKQAMKAEDTFDKLTEAEGSKVASFLSNPNSATNAADMRNLKNWLDSSSELTGVLTKYYKDIPELQNEVASINRMRSRVLDNLQRAGEDVSRYKRPGATSFDIAAEDVEIANKRGLPYSESADEIDRLSRKRERFTKNPKERLALEHEYAGKVNKNTEELYDLDSVYGKIRKARRIGVSAIPGTVARLGSADTVRAMWGDRPITTLDKEGEVAVRSAISDQRAKKNKQTTTDVSQ